jgi:hypothetical protein
MNAIFGLLLLLLLSLHIEAGLFSKKKEKKDVEQKKMSKKEQAKYDIATGMKGMHDAAQDPAMLAQLMRDMQVRRW